MLAGGCGTKQLLCILKCLQIFVRTRFNLLLAEIKVDDRSILFLLEKLKSVIDTNEKEHCKINTFIAVIPEFEMFNIHFFNINVLSLKMFHFNGC